MVWDKGIVKNLLGQLAEQSGILGNPRAGGSSLRKSELGKPRKDLISFLLLSECLIFFFFFSFLGADFPCPLMWQAE